MTRGPTQVRPDLFIHAGLHKTGTTYLQKYVFPRIEGGSFVLGTHRMSFRLIDDFSKATPPVLWSQETLSGIRESGEYRETQRRILRFLASTFPGSGLILFLREPSQLTKSLYVQYIHQGGSEPFDSWFEEYRDAFWFDSLLEEIDRMGWGRVLLFEHDQLRKDPHFVIGTLERVMGCTFPGWESTQGTRSNPSVARSGARTLRAINRYLVTYKSRKGSRRLTKFVKFTGLAPVYRIQEGSLRWLNKVGKPLIEEETLDQIRRRYSDSWKRTRDRIRENQARLSAEFIDDPSEGQGQGEGQDQAQIEGQPQAPYPPHQQLPGGPVRVDGRDPRLHASRRSRSSGDRSVGLHGRDE